MVMSCTFVVTVLSGKGGCNWKLLGRLSSKSGSGRSNGLIMVGRKPPPIAQSMSVWRLLKGRCDVLGFLGRVAARVFGFMPRDKRRSSIVKGPDDDDNDDDDDDAGTRAFDSVVVRSGNDSDLSSKSGKSLLISSGGWKNGAPPPRSLIDSASVVGAVR